VAERAAAAGRRLSAWLALAVLPLVLLALVWFVVRSFRDLAAVGPGAVLVVVVLAAAGWWAFTTRRVWKRRLNLAVAALAVAGLAGGLVYLGVGHSWDALAVAAVALAYVTAARRTLGVDEVRRVALDRAVVGVRPPPVRPWLLINPKSGDGKALRLGLADVAAQRGIRVRMLASDDDPPVLALDAVAEGADAIGVAGGDGSLGPIAAVAMRLNVPFVCVPTGTRNHFAHDLGLDRTKPLHALDAFVGVERRIDAAAVGGRVFLNNVSLGVYADIVRDAGYRARKLTTTHAVLPAVLRGEQAPLAVRVDGREGHDDDRSLMLLVANNRYELRRAFRLGARHRLDAGVLHVMALRVSTGARLAMLVARVAAGDDVASARWAQWTSTAVHVDAESGRLPAAVDGEAAVLDTPLEFRALPLALRVLVPVGTPRARAMDVRPFSPETIRRLWAVASGGSGG